MPAKRWEAAPILPLLSKRIYRQWLTAFFFLSNLRTYAEVVELVDTLASGASGGNPVEVQVLFSVPLMEFLWIRNGSKKHLTSWSLTFSYQIFLNSSLLFAYNRAHFG